MQFKTAYFKKKKKRKKIAEKQILNLPLVDFGFIEQCLWLVHFC